MRLAPGMALAQPLLSDRRRLTLFFQFIAELFFTSTSECFFNSNAPATPFSLPQGVFPTASQPGRLFPLPTRCGFHSNSGGKKQTRSQYRTLARKGRWQGAHPGQTPRGVEPTTRLGLAMGPRPTTRAPAKHRLLESRQALNGGGLRYYELRLKKSCNIDVLVHRVAEELQPTGRDGPSLGAMQARSTCTSKLQRSSTLKTFFTNMS
mgnify:CR=1 FL=1